VGEVAVGGGVATRVQAISSSSFSYEQKRSDGCNEANTRLEAGRLMPNNVF